MMKIVGERETQNTTTTTTTKTEKSKGGTKAIVKESGLNDFVVHLS